MEEQKKSPISRKRESWGKALKVTGVIEVCSLLLYLYGVFTAAHGRTYPPEYLEQSFAIIQWSYLIFVITSIAFSVSLLAFIAADLLDAYRQSPKA